MFYSNIANNTSLGKAITNEQGQATIQHTGDAKGYGTITATFEDLTADIPIYDCIAYKLEEYSKTGPNTTEVDYPVGLDWTGESFVVEFEMNTAGAGTSFVIRNSITNKATNVGIGGSGYRSVWGDWCRGNFSQTWPYSVWTTMKVVISPQDFKFYMNEELIRQCSDISNLDGDWYFAVRTWNVGRVVKVRNIKVLPKV